MIDVQITIFASYTTDHNGQWHLVLLPKGWKSSGFLFAAQCASTSASASGWCCVCEQRGGPGQKRRQSETQDHLQLRKFKNISFCPFLIFLLIKNKSSAWDGTERNYNGFAKTQGGQHRFLHGPYDPAGGQTIHAHTHNTKSNKQNSRGESSVTLFWCCCQLAAGLLNMSTVGSFSLFWRRRQLPINRRS